LGNTVFIHVNDNESFCLRCALGDADKRLPAMGDRNDPSIMINETCFGSGEVRFAQHRLLSVYYSLLYC